MTIEENQLEKRTRTLMLGVLLATSFLVASRPLFSTFVLAACRDEYTHILLILPISLGLIWARWKSAQSLIKSDIGYGLVLLFAAVLTAGFSSLHLAPMTADLQTSIEMLALVLWWIGSFVFCFGTKTFRELLFPLLFLFWMIPLPTLVMNEVIKYLQQGSAFSARLLFAAVGVPVAQDGAMLTIPGLAVEIAKECSSIRSSLLLLITTMVLAQIFLRSTWARTLVVALAVPLSVAKNGIRIFTLAMLATRVDPEFLTGRLHRQGGVVFYVISLLVMFLLIGLLRRGEAQAGAKRTLVVPAN